MADLHRHCFAYRDTEEAIAALKKGSYLLKYGRRGKPKFYPFRLSTDETLLVWFSGKVEKQLKLSHVSKIIPGQRTAIFKRYPQPEKEYQSFSLIYGDRSLDVICKDKGEADVWIVALGALISHGSHCKLITDAKGDNGSPSSHTRKNSSSNVSCSSNDIIYKDPEEIRTLLVPYETSPQNRLGKAFSEVVSFTAAAKAYARAESIAKSYGFPSSRGFNEVEGFRVSFSSTVGSSSHASSHEDFDLLSDVLIWGEGLGNGPLSGTQHNLGSFIVAIDALLPKALDTTMVLDARNIACGSKHAVLTTKQGQIFSWGDGSGGKLGHGVEADFSRPKVIDALRGSRVEVVACGEFHTCAVTLSGNLLTWGDGTQGVGLLGHGSEVGHWTPKKVSGEMEGVHVSYVSCGPWHTAAVTSHGKLFTFGDGTFGALGHGDCISAFKPREVESLKGLRTVMVSCGVWHTAAVVDVVNDMERSSNLLSGKLFTWGNGDKGQLGHGNVESKLVPSCVAMPDESSDFCHVACGNSITVALTVSGQVYTMGSGDYGQLGNPGSIGNIPACVEGDIKNIHIEKIACGTHHIAAMSSNGEVYTWGKGTNGQLGHGDIDDRHIPTIVEAVRDKQLKSIVCGSNFTAVICAQKCVSSSDLTICSGCRNSFGFRRKRHNCYNCGLVFCNACSSKKSSKASLAPKVNKPYRVCNECFVKLMRSKEHGSNFEIPNIPSGSMHRDCNEAAESETLSSKSHHQLSRLSSFDSFKQAIKHYSQWNHKVESHKFSASPTSKFGRHLKKLSNSVPVSRRVSRAASPVSSKSSPSQPLKSAFSLNDLANEELILDNSKQTNGSPTQEMISLMGQVEHLNHKSQILEAKLEKTARQLKEATKTLKEEVDKNKAAKEVISSLTAQLKSVVTGGSKFIVLTQPP